VAAVALVVAAGRGERLGSDGPKALVRLAGLPLLEWSIAALRDVPAIGAIVVAMPPGCPVPDGCIAVPGGATRSHSVRAALQAAAPDLDPVLVQDAARPFLSPALAEAVLAAVDGVDGAIAAAPVTDTIKQADGAHIVERTLDRSLLWAVQTPQVFRRRALEQALDAPDDILAAASDDASLIERAGGKIRVVPAPRENLKVTTPLDLAVAELLMQQRLRP
jgi:2-C-methyl-D-erythritol 4-phosphate cytidylyltransferase